MVRRYNEVVASQVSITNASPLIGRAKELQPVQHIIIIRPLTLSTSQLLVHLFYKVTWKDSACCRFQHFFFCAVNKDSPIRCRLYPLTAYYARRSSPSLGQIASFYVLKHNFRYSQTYQSWTDQLFDTAFGISDHPFNSTCWSSNHLASSPLARFQCRINVRRHLSEKLLLP